MVEVLADKAMDIAIELEAEAMKESVTVTSDSSPADLTEPSDQTVLDKTTMPGVVCILVAGLILSNLHITPFSSAVSDFVGQYIVAAAIPLLMIKADLKKIFLESGRVMLGFAAACVGIVSGALLGYYLLHPWHIGAKVAGMYAGAFVGGTISMIAVANAVQMTPTELSVATGASMIPSVLGLMALVALPNLRLVQRHFPAPRADGSAAGQTQLAAATAVPPFRLTHITGALALSFSICAVATGGRGPGAEVHRTRPQPVPHPLRHDRHHRGRQPLPGPAACATGGVRARHDLHVHVLCSDRARHEYHVLPR